MMLSRNGRLLSLWRLSTRPTATIRRPSIWQYSSEAATSSEEPALLVTERCAKRINKLREEDPQLCLRIEVDGGGCQGFQYNFKLDQLSSIEKDVDRVFELDGASVVIDEASLEVLKGSKVDYKSDLIGSAFVVGDNPHAEATCGCKRSFTLK